MTEGHPIDPIAATLGILGFAVLGFLSNRIPIALVATGVALALFFTGVLSLPEALAGFGDPTVLFIASLFVVSESLDATGVTAWAGQKMIAQAGSRHTALIVLISLLVAVLTALISVNGGGRRTTPPHVAYRPPRSPRSVRLPHAAGLAMASNRAPSAIHRRPRCGCTFGAAPRRH